MKGKSTVHLLLFAVLFSAVPLRAGQAAVKNRAADGSLEQSPKATSPGNFAKKIDVCALLTSAEVEAVQGEPIKETKPSEQHGNNSFVMSQCVLRTATFAKSVSLALAVPDPARPSAINPREYWQKQFHPREQVEREKEEPTGGKANSSKETEEREKEMLKPLPVAGIGEEAYWTGNRITGALYVLKGNAFLRISMGGSEDESTRIQKAKTLAQKALVRLDQNQ